MNKSALITVGSTKFNELIDRSFDIAEILSYKGYREIFIQHGESQLPLKDKPKGIDIKTFDYVKNMSIYISNVDLIISHGGRLE